MPNNEHCNKMNHEKSDTKTKQDSVMLNILKGSLIGAAEVAIDHPLWVIKTRMQNKEKFTLSPRILYRGITANMASMMPITAIQVAATNVLEATFFPVTQNNKPQVNSELQNIACAFVGGAASASVSTGTELVMAHMTPKRGFLQTAKWFNTMGFRRLNTGFVGTATRDGIFTIGFMKAPILVEKQLVNLFPNHRKVSSAISGPLAGVLAAVASHPFDSIKTRQQKAAHQSKLTFMEAASQIIKNDGFFALYKGLAPRSTRVVSAITIMDKVGRELDIYFKKKN